MIGRLRWALADWLDRLYPRACWADLATWAMGHTAWADIDWQGAGCERDIAVTGACWCQKRIQPASATR